MIQKWFEDYYFVYTLAGLCLMGFIIKLIMNFVYIRLVRASGNMSASENKLVKNMKLKFETFYKLKIGVNNVDIFVDKYVYKYKFCGLLLSTWENISGLIFMLCMLITPVVSLYGLIIECKKQTILCTFFAGICASSILLIVDNLFNITSKQKLIKLNIKDYLENYLKVRLEQEAQDPDMFRQYRLEMASSLESGISKKQLKKEAKQKEKERLEQEKFLRREEKEQERQERRDAKLAMKEERIARREEAKAKKEEERQMLREEKAEAKMRAMREKEEREQQKEFERQQVAKLARMVKEEEASNPKNIHKTDKNSVKHNKMQQRNEQLKEEIKAQREQREKDRLAGKDPFETYAGTKGSEKVKNQKVSDFNMEYELSVKAAQREEAKRKKVVEMEQMQAEETQVQVQTMEREQSVFRGSNPSEDKLIDDILKEFLA